MQLDLVEKKVSGEDQLKPDLRSTLDVERPVLVGFIIVEFSPAGHWIADGTANGRVALWDTKTAKQLLRFERQLTAIRRIAISDDGTHLAAVTEDGTTTV